MNYQPELRRSLRCSNRKRTRSSYEDTSDASEQDTGRTSRSKTSLRNQEEGNSKMIQQDDVEDLTCAICLEKLSDPHLLPDCCHRFCGGCIKESISKGNMSCPSCRVRIPTKRYLRKDDLLEKLLFRLERLEAENVHLRHILEKKEQRVIEQDNFDEDENQEHDDFGEDENQEHDDTAARKRFEKRFNDLKEYKSQNGHCNVPYAYKAHDNLGRWVGRIRNMKSGSVENSGVYELTKARIKMLENIGFRWNAWQTFEERFDALKEYKRKHGHCNVSQSYKAHDNLGQWVLKIRRMKCGSQENRGCYKLTKARIKMLENIGFRWKANHSFEERFDALKEYKRKHGHCNVPQSYKAHDNLGRWVGRIRNMKSGSVENSGVYELTKARIKMLENIGFRWKANHSFEERFDALKEYKSQNGHCNVPYAYRSNDNLGGWVSRIRSMKSGAHENSGAYELTKARIKMLENIGFRWKV